MMTTGGMCTITYGRLAEMARNVLKRPDYLYDILCDAMTARTILRDQFLFELYRNLKDGEWIYEH